MNRYSILDNKIKREIVLLKGFPCRWGRCRFCDYIEDNSIDEENNIRINSDALANVSGRYGVLEVINSGNIFELPRRTLEEIREIIKLKGIHTLFFEAHWIYRDEIAGMREFFNITTIVKTGLESFDFNFRNKVLNKGIPSLEIEDIKEYFDSVCLLVGIQGQTKEMIRKDIELAGKHFDHFTVNVFVENSTPVNADLNLIEWFTREYSYLDDLDKCDVLWANTDFGVG